MAAMVALLHDILITVGFYAIVGREVNLVTVVAVLTVLGYSLYDTIIIFDRIRENAPEGGYNRRRFDQTINNSIRQVVRRSIYTSLCTLIPITALLIFGETTLGDFAFALLVGILAGTYSSIFIAAPVLCSTRRGARAGFGLRGRPRPFRGICRARRATPASATASGSWETTNKHILQAGDSGGAFALSCGATSTLHRREVSYARNDKRDVRRLVLLQIGAAAASRERIEEVVESLIEQGRIQREEGKTLVDQVAGRARERSSGARSLMDATAQQGLRKAGLPTRDDYEDLIFRVEQLEHRVRLLEDRPWGHPPRSRRPRAPAGRRV